jgi:type II secretory pathway component PulF
MSRFFRWILEIVFWGFTCLGLMLFLSVIIGAGVQPVIAYAAPVIPLIALPMIGMIVRSRRQKRLQAVLVHVEHAVRLNLPLVQMIAAARDSESGVLRERLNALAVALREGYSMADALEVALPECTDQVVATIAAGEQIGRLAPALRRLVEDSRTADDIPDPVLRPFHRVYPLIVLVAITTCLAVLSIFVMPKFREIMRDFGMQQRH